MPRAMSTNDPLDFVMAFVAQSKKYKSQYVDRWRESVNNFIVEPHETANVTTDPYRTHKYGATYTNTYSDPKGGIILKDGETHKAIMTYASKLVKAIFGDGRNEFVKAEPVGWEDAA